MRRFVGVIVAGFLAGMVVIGGGGRLVMRLLVMTSSESTHGAFTDDAERINEFTVLGTVGLILFSGLFAGAIGGLLYGAIRPVLSDESAKRLRTCAFIGAAVGSTVFIDPDGRDFGILSPLWLAVLSFVVLSALFGLAVCWLADRLLPFYESAPFRFPHMLAFLPAAVVLLIPPIIFGVLVVASVYAATATRERPPWLYPAGRMLMAVLVGALGATGVQKMLDVEARDVHRSDFVKPEFD